jgi:Kef-type K+ transport system membrane component KefB
VPWFLPIPCRDPEAISVVIVFQDAFYEIAALLAVAAACGALAISLHQPLIVAYIVAGLLVGPSGLGWVAASDQVDLLAQMGIALLLFVVGLRLDLHLIRTMGRVVLVTGLVQMAVTAALGYLLAVALDLAPMAALYVAVALTFSSTIIVVKLLSDKREIDALHGRIALGILIVQDIVVVLAIIALTALGAEAASTLGRDVLLMSVKGGAFLIAVGLFARYVLPTLLHRLARSQELLVLAAVAWAVALAAIGAGLGFSKEVGAFVGGVAIASTPYRDAIGARLTGLRDFLLLFFFIDLGAHLGPGLTGEQVGAALLLSAFVLAGKPLIILAILGRAGYRKRTLSMTAFSLGQISEFSLILGALGLSIGHIDAEIVSLITLVGLVTFSLSSYMISYSHLLYESLAPWLTAFERRVPHREQAHDVEGEDAKADVILLGLGRYGSIIAHAMRQRGLKVLGVDFDPEVVRAHRQEGVWVRYGDAEDPELFATLPVGRARWVMSSIPQRAINLALLHALRHQGYRGRIAVTTHTPNTTKVLQAAGADLVLLPFADAADQAVDLLMMHDKGKDYPRHAPADDREKNYRKEERDQ